MLGNKRAQDLPIAGNLPQQAFGGQVLFTVPHKAAWRLMLPDMTASNKVSETNAYNIPVVLMRNQLPPPQRSNLTRLMSRNVVLPHGSA